MITFLSEPSELPNEIIFVVDLDVAYMYTFGNKAISVIEVFGV